jgi:hypothetical protein
MSPDRPICVWIIEGPCRSYGPPLAWYERPRSVGPACSGFYVRGSPAGCPIFSSTIILKPLENRTILILEYDENKSIFSSVSQTFANIQK